MAPRRWARDVATTLAFYSRLPLTVRDPPPLAQTAWSVPVAALLLATPAALAMALAHAAGFPSLAAAFVGVGALVVVTGALHEDGLADCVDGFWGGATAERRLAIMRDSRIGTYGVVALVLALGLKAALLEHALGDGTADAMALLVVGAVAGRTAALYPWVRLPSARPDGLAVAMGRPTPATFRTAVILALLVGAALTVWVSPLGFVAAAAGAALTAKGMSSLAEAKVGGHTGDVIGAAVVAGDLSTLVIVTICR
ncbi:adenosylcobinamide-GDP ribazoletransferase [Acuticoccus sp.]|uniref:adenosylcobinamide-GDP ribazoletransferase n=1 Tax=Acuticoccus sp. TaxID=1904378 RepID=UPI003B51FD82